MAHVAKATARENAGRDTHECVPSDLVMSDNDPRRAKLDPVYAGPYEVDAVRSNGSVVNAIKIPFTCASSDLPRRRWGTLL
ncbi:hypothetical protein GN244_ATG18994 [Phytophthora infestans]|uniref:Uncharacterized protein n=1 Tax=Phytophthora infestans TaxID=4787 RepID=A0A833RYR6_PHYIN|nr:hypothetical protein GN244_ATG19197 [Phytophthora infestans]KAF4029284.1 hypothetical protein GN244_ATG18994 [Phytophthora infestans]KAF4136377.1 hypothetical protein GN958_ATG14438 [Phytophthora infestans]